MNGSVVEVSRFSLMQLEEKMFGYHDKEHLCSIVAKTAVLPSLLLLLMMMTWRCNRQ
jgi:hypothetical protein